MNGRIAASPRFLVLGLPAMAAAALISQASILSSGDPKTQTEAAPRAAAVPQYTADGELKRPTDYRTWVFVGANMGLEYRDDDAKDPPPRKDQAHVKVGNFHNVYINPESYRHYMKTGEFPQKTMLVLDIYKGEKGDPKSVVAEGLFPGNESGFAMAVKNSARPDGSTTDWAYYDFGVDKQSAKALPDRACYDCHLQHANEDNVWVQFYPTLRKSRQAKK
ncbi:MAG TPA: cytochrome P460 family protein [Planctomycetaceae bacterium]|nr:cytochrome P460 family protein [Planctomycetaceae bacterium]